MNFIRLTAKNTEPFYLNAAQIVGIERKVSCGVTEITTVNGDFNAVETPAQIAEILARTSIIFTTD
jgi:uncharacterized protein YlzI (FlbEa/FlbD family)